MVDQTEIIQQIEANGRILQLLQTAQYAEAEKLCHWLMEASEGVEKPNFYLGVAQQFQGKLTQALLSFEAAHNADLKDVNILQAIASCHEQLGQFETAHTILQKAAAIAPANAGLMANLGAISEKLKDGLQANLYYQQALALDPKNYIAHMNYGTLLISLGQHFNGLNQCLAAHVCHPQSLGIIYNLVSAFMAVFNYQEALSYCDKGLAIQENHASLLFKKGLILSCLQRYNEAAFALANAQVIDPRVLQNALLQPSVDPLIEYHLEPRLLYLDAMYQAQSKCSWQGREAYLVEMQYGIAQTGFMSNIEFAFHLLSLPIESTARLALTRSASAFIQDLTWLKGVPPFKHKLRARKKIRIGYFSSDFRAHPTGLLSRQLYDLHDKTQFEIYIYSTFNATEKDQVRLTVENQCDVFHDVSRLSDGAIAQQIFADEIDILVDFNGYTAKSRSCVVAMRPAPVQLLYLAYLQSMGADFIDYTIVDKVIAPPELEPHWQEKIARLPHSLYLYDIETPNTPTIKSRADYGLPEGVFVFCCLNTPYKIEPQIFDVWMDILHAAPHSVLWLLGNDDLTIANLRREAGLRNIPNDRIVFAEPLPHAEHLQRYQQADLFIDTYWCGAHTTALDALWQGLPVLCCTAEVSTARVGASFLQVLEMLELVTTDFEQYREKAIYYASNPEALAALKQKLADKKITTPLFKPSLTVKHIEKAYQHMWQRHLQGLAPETFNVLAETDFLN